MRKKNLLIFLSILIISCNNDHGYKTLNYKSFKIQVPKSWKKINIHGIDSNVGILTTKDHDTIRFDIGIYSNSLEENPLIIDKTILKEILKEHPQEDVSEYIIVNDMKNINVNNYLKSKIHYEKIDNYNAKILEAKKPEKGITGIYIDSIKNSSSGKIGFNFYGINLKKNNQKALLKAIKTLKFQN